MFIVFKLIYVVSIYYLFTFLVFFFCCADNVTTVNGKEILSCIQEIDCLFIVAFFRLNPEVVLFLVVIFVLLWTEVNMFFSFLSISSRVIEWNLTVHPPQQISYMVILHVLHGLGINCTCWASVPIYTYRSCAWTLWNGKCWIHFLR